MLSTHAIIYLFHDMHVVVRGDFNSLENYHFRCMLHVRSFIYLKCSQYFYLVWQSWGCGNPIFGETKNCLNSDLGPGGSSGGEGSLIGSGGSVFGIGTDAAGSVRIPAHFCGIASLKPSKMRYRFVLQTKKCISWLEIDLFYFMGRMFFLL